MAINKDDLRALQVLCKEIGEEICKEHALYSRHQTVFNPRNSTLQVMLDAEKGYFDFQDRFIEEVKESSDIDMDSDNKKIRDDCYALRGLLVLKQEPMTNEEMKVVKELNETIKRKNQLIGKYEKLKKKVGI